MHIDIAIVGGGLAGSALAAHLARAGRRVAVFEKDEFPRDKLCGEFLSTESQRLLQSLGVWPAIRALEPVPIRRARFTAPSGIDLHLKLPGTALGISRRALDEILFRHAGQSGAVAVAGADVRDVRPTADGRAELAIRAASNASAVPASVSAHLVAGAWGRRSRLDRALDRPFFAVPQPFVGLKRHHRPLANAAGDALRDAVRDAVEIHAVPGGYCGMSFIETGEINVCMLLEKRFLDALPDARWDTVREALGRANRALRRRLEALEPAESGTHAVAQVPFISKCRHAGPVIFLGDSAGVIAPLCGDGQAMALQSAELLAQIILARGDAALDAESVREIAVEWERHFRRHFGWRLWIGRHLQTLLFRPSAAEALIRGLRLSPAITQFLASTTRGH